MRERAEGLCERCTAVGHTVHHRKNRSAGGDWSVSNLLFLCGDGVRGCHGWATVRPRAAHDIGFHVKPWEDPREVPVLWRGNEWVLLRDDGTMVDVQ